VYTCEESVARFPYGTDASTRTQVQFRLPDSGEASFSATTLAAEYNPSGPSPDLIRVVDNSGCIVNGRMYILETAAPYADIVTVLECDVQSGGISYVRIALPYPTATLPTATTHVAFFTLSVCPAPAPTSSCFTDAGLVNVEGVLIPKPLAELREGDRVFDGASYTGVIGFLHELGTAGDIVSIEHAGGELRASPLHMLFARAGEKEARNIEVGDELLVSPGRFAEVLTVRTDKTVGFKAPLTASGSITVDGTTASNYATVNGLPLTHAAMHVAFFPARVAAAFFDNLTRVPTGKTAEKTTTEFHHPLVDLYVRVLKFDDALRFLQ